MKLTQMGLACTAVLVCNMAACQPASTSRSADQRCNSVVDQPEFVFQGRKLREIPDITAPELRKANLLVSMRCYDEAYALSAAYASKNPEDYKAAFIEMRLIWISGSPSSTRIMVDQALAKHPEFTSARVLLASLQLEGSDYPAAAKTLDEIERQSPTDLWMYMDQLKLEALQKPSATLAATLLALARDKRFPPSARETATQMGREFPNLQPSQYEDFFKAALEFESATKMGCKYFNYANHLSEIEERYADTRKLLESAGARAADCTSVLSNRFLLAQAYLMEAAAVNPGPSPANAELARKAREVLDGNLIPFATWIVNRPTQATLEPFLRGQIPVDAVDGNGYTPICSALIASNVEGVRAQLANGANAKGRCLEYTLLEQTLPEPLSFYTQQRVEIARLLLEKGARLDQQTLEACKSSEFCNKELLPMLKKYHNQ